MGWIKGSKKHNLGNVICGILTVIDGIGMMLTLGNYNPSFTLRWNMHRRSKGVLYDGNK